MGFVNCQIRGPDPQDFTILREKPPKRIFVVLRETDEKTNDLQAGQILARNVETFVRCVETQRKAKMGFRKNQNAITLEDYVVFTSLIPRMRNSRIS